MIDDRQVNLWRGSSTPPTIYHIWIRGSQMLIYNETEWIVFIDDETTIQKINQLITDINTVKANINSINDYTINNKLIKNSPILNGGDLESGISGHYIVNTETVSQSFIKLDTLLTTQIIE